MLSNRNAESSQIVLILFGVSIRRLEPLPHPPRHAGRRPAVVSRLGKQMVVGGAAEATRFRRWFRKQQDRLKVSSESLLASVLLGASCETVCVGVRV